MPKKATISTITIFEQSGLLVMGYYTGNDGAGILEADFGTIKARVSLKDAGEALTYDATLTTADVVEDTPVTDDARWTDAGGSATGYNFITTIPASAFPTADTYQLDLEFAPSSGEVYRDQVEVVTLEVRTS